jgi:hypothetical protein
MQTYAPAYAVAGPASYRPPAGVEVKVSYLARTIFSVLFGIPWLAFALYCVVASLLASDDVSQARGALLFAMAPGLVGMIFVCIPLLYVLEKSSMVARMDPAGLTMRNGARYAWSEFQGIVPLIRISKYGHRSEMGVDVCFARGRGRILYRPLCNTGEVRFVIERLRQRQNPFA